MSDTIKTVLIDGGLPVPVANEQTRFIYNLLPVGKFYDKRYGTVNVTGEKLKRMADNFGKYPSYEVPVKLGHSDGAKSPGKVIAAEAKDSGLEITMLVDEDTAKAINDKQYRYMSAEFDENYHDKETGNPVGAVLLGAALVNQPANPYMQPLKLVDDIKPEPEPEKTILNPDTKNEKGNENMTELEDMRLQMSDMKMQMKAMKEEAEANAKKFADVQSENEELKKERERAENEKNEAEVKAFCDKWTAQGIPPVTLEKVKPILLAKTSRVIKLSDDARDDVKSLKFFDELFAGLPKMPMKQISGSEAPATELSDVQKAIERGKAIAESVK